MGPAVNARRGVHETLVRAAVGIAAVVSLIFSAGAPALAEVPSPPPPEPVAGCEWYGELTESVVMEYRNEPEQSTQDRLIEKVFSSQDAEGDGCAAFYSETYFDDFLDEGTDWCDPSPVGGDEYLAPTSYRVTLEGETSGTGGLTAVLDDNAGSPEIRIHGIGAAYEVSSTTVGVWPCGDIETGTTTAATAAVNSEVGFTDDCSAETAVPDLSVQVVIGTCQVTTVSDHGPGATTTETITWTWRFARDVCDVSVDTDGGGVGDCAEFEQETNPNDPADDTPFADSDGDGVQDGSDQCPGTPAGEPVDANGCPDDRDSDGDGVLDESDQCANTPSGVPVDAFGCTLDSDGDGVHDGLDNCAEVPNSDQSDLDANGVGDACENHDPVAVSDATTTLPGASVDVNVLANDTDPDGDTIALESCTDGSFGSVEIAQGYARYTPLAGYAGADSFTCTIVDGRGGSDSAEVAVTILNAEVQLHLSIDYLAYWYDYVPSVSLFGRGGGSDRLILEGASSAWLTGDAASLSTVQKVCITPKFQVMVDRNISTVPVNWSEGGRDLMGQDDYFWNSPPAATSGGFGSELTSKAAVCSAVPGSSAAWSPEAGVLMAETNQPGQNVNIVSITHTLMVTVYFVGGKTYTTTLEEAEKSAKKTPKITDLDEIPKRPITIRP